MAKGYTAIHTAGCLILPFILWERYFYFTVIIDSFLYGPVPRNLPPYL
jgi:hypothetical protein